MAQPPIRKQPPASALPEDHFDVASTTECTGLVPAAPATDAEAEAYEDVYNIPMTDDYQPPLRKTKHPQ